MELCLLSFFPREGKGVPDFDLVPFLPPASACMFMQFHVWQLDYSLWCSWNISHLRKSVGGNRNRPVRIWKSRDCRSFPHEHFCPGWSLARGSNLRLWMFVGSQLKITWLLNTILYFEFKVPLNWLFWVIDTLKMCRSASGFILMTSVLYCDCEISLDGAFSP